LKPTSWCLCSARCSLFVRGFPCRYTSRWMRYFAAKAHSVLGTLEKSVSAFLPRFWIFPQFRVFRDFWEIPRIYTSKLFPHFLAFFWRVSRVPTQYIVQIAPTAVGFLRSWAFPFLVCIQTGATLWLTANCPRLCSFFARTFKNV